MKLSKTKKALYGNLNSVKMRRRHGLFTVEGEKAVADTARYFDYEAIIRLTGCDGQYVVENGKCPDRVCPNENVSGIIPVYEVNESEMKELSYLATPSTVIGVFRLPVPILEDSLKVNSETLYLVLDGVRDPGNMGTIIRTCHWFGIFTIYASHDCVDCFNPKVVQSSMGSLGAVQVKYCNLIELFNANPEMPIYGTLLEGENIYKATLCEHGFLVMGNEGVGVSTSVRSRITLGLNIPPTTDNHGESLNVAIAAAVVISAFRQRAVAGEA